MPKRRPTSSPGRICTASTAMAYRCSPAMTGCAATGGRTWMRPRIIKETPVSALVDGDGGLGHVPARFAMQVAIDKAKQSGMAIAAVRNSAHFGATGYYTLMAAKEGLIGMACTSASSIQVAPTFGKEAEPGADAWSFD